MTRSVPFAPLDVEAAAANEAAHHSAPARLHTLRRAVLPTHAELEEAATQASEAELRAQLCDYSELCALLELYCERCGSAEAAAARLHAHASGAARKLQRANLDSDFEQSPLPSAAALLALRREELLSQVARALQSAGCPVWRLEFNLSTVSRGLGCPGTEVAAFPRFVLLSFGRLAAAAGGAQTLFVKTARGMNMAKLDGVDSLCRRAASWGTDSTAPVARARAGGDGEDRRRRLAAAAAVGRAELPARLEAARVRYEWGAVGEAQLVKDVLDLACNGPGFFHFSASAAQADAEVEDDWSLGGGGDSLRAGALYATPDPSSHGGAAFPPPAAPAAAAALAQRTASGECARGGALFSPPEPPGVCDLPAALARPQGHRARRIAFTALALDEALRSLAQLEAEPPLYSAAQQIAAMAVSSAGCAPVFFDGGVGEALAAGALGGLVGAFGVYVVAHGRWQRAFEFVSAVVVSFLARAADGHIAPLCLDPVILSALSACCAASEWTLADAFCSCASLAGAGLDADQRGGGDCDQQPDLRCVRAAPLGALSV